MTPHRTINHIYCVESFPYQTECFLARSAHQAKAKPSLRTDAGGVGDLVAEYAYDAFGNTIYEDGDMADFFPHRFSTKYYDAETDLYDYGYRHYSPSLGRWISRDPIQEDAPTPLRADVAQRSGRE